MKIISRRIPLLIAVSAFIIFFTLSALSLLLPFKRSFFSSILTPGSLFGQESPAFLPEKHDYVLVIDESGSMKQNDPQYLRRDAAKLFIYLAETLNKGNRVLISGFGQKTNIYLPMTEISGNEGKISQAIDSIESSQSYTDMKGALEYIKKELDFRTEKNKTVLIFLTDGALTIDDIPPQVQEPQKPSRERPGKPPKEDGAGIIGDAIDNSYMPDTDKTSESNDKNFIKGYGSSTATEDETENESDVPKRESDFLEFYKKELLKLCEEYNYSEIVIHPIAFTKEADISLLESIADITGGICYNPQKAKDLRVSFIEILGNISSRFIKIMDQPDSSPMSGDIEINGYIKELVAIGLKNNYASVPSVKLFDPKGIAAVFEEYTDEDIFKIGKMISPSEGKWSYQINGDAIFVYDISQPVPSEPQFELYAADAIIPVEVNISGVLLEKTEGKENPEDVLADFAVSATVKSPSCDEYTLTDLNDGGTGGDLIANDGNFTAIFDRTSQQGYYEINYEVKHMPTDSISARALNFEVAKFPVKIISVQPLEEYYMPDEEIKIVVQVKKDIEDGNSDDFAGLIFSAGATSQQGIVTKDILLLDNGQGADDVSGDGLYSAVFAGPSLPGSYRIDYFISGGEILSRPACTGFYSLFEIRSVQNAGAEIKNSYFTGEPASVTVDIKNIYQPENPLVYSSASLSYTLTKPDGTLSYGSLFDDGNLQNSDIEGGDGIYSALIKDLEQTGKYEIEIEGSFFPQTSPAPQSEAQTTSAIYINAAEAFYKYYQIKNVPESILLDEGQAESIIDFVILSAASDDSNISLDSAYLSSGTISAAQKSNVVESSPDGANVSTTETKQSAAMPLKASVLKSSEIIKAGIENSVSIEIEISPGTKAGNYILHLPIKIGENTTKILEFDIEIARSSPPYMIIAVIAAGVVLFAGIILLVYFLYIRPRKMFY
ncbi:MAG: VWA domain-containing protein [Actinobacteria bacterium]|nr:VWA domain-containing protein [Actinomycetota bacterium]